jgi:DNA topoisomerase-1
MALEHLIGSPAQAASDRRRALVGVAKEISRFLCNTPAVVRKSYIHARIMEEFENRTLPDNLRRSRLNDCRKGEMLLYRFLTKPAE